MSEMKLIDKRVSHAFGKKIYLLGVFKSGEKFWLEAPSWDCGWYWGFGYIETYTNNNNPSEARDIRSHQHYKGLFIGKGETYDFEKKCFVLESDYKHKIGDNKDVVACVLTEKEQWELADLMKTFYTLREASDVFNRGGSHISTSRADVSDKYMYTRINHVLLQRVFARIDELLTPDPSDNEGKHKSY